MKLYSILVFLVLATAQLFGQRSPFTEIRRAAATAYVDPSAIANDSGSGTNITLYGDTTINNVIANGTILTPLTADSAIVTDASGYLAASAVTATELGFVSGVTNALQTQINDITRPSTKYYGVYSNVATFPTVIVNFTNNPATFAHIAVTNCFSLLVSNYFTNASMLLKLVPHTLNATNYIVTLDASWERYGVNFTTNVITVPSNKSVTISLHSWNTLASGISAAYRTQQ